MDSIPTLNTTSSDNKPKWQKPEKAGAWAVLLGAGAVALYFWGTIVPFIVAMLADTIESMILFGAIAAIVVVGSNKRFRTAMSYLFRIFLRKTIGMVIAIDPIEVMQVSIEKAIEQKKEIDDHLTALVGKKEKLDNNIAANNQKMQDDFDKANKAKGMNKPEAAQLLVLEAGGLKQINDELLPLQGKMKQIIAFMGEVSKAGDFNIKKSQIQVKTLKMKYEMVKEAWGGLKAAMELFKGGGNDTLMFEQAADYINNDIAAKTGEMKRAMELSTEFIDNMDIEKGVYQDKGYELLEQFNKGGLKLLNDYQSQDGQPLQNNFMPQQAQVIATQSISEKDKMLLG